MLLRLRTSTLSALPSIVFSVMLLQTQWTPAGAVAAEKTLAEKLIPFEKVEKRQNLLRHAGEYPTLRIRWLPEGVLRNIQEVFPHPILPYRIFAALEAGVAVSEDSGKTWKELPASTKVGRVNSIAFAADQIDLLYLGTSTKGLWRSTDNGVTITRFAGADKGMAADSIAKVYAAPGGRHFNTILAIHDEASTGISRTEDGGRSWSVLAEDYHVRELLFDHNKVIYMAGAKAASKELYGVYYTNTLGSYWLEVVRDVQATAGDLAILSGGEVYWSTASSGMYCIRNQGASLTRFGGSSREENWTSIGVTFGPHADREVVYAYNPYKEGMLLSEDQGETFRNESRNLFTGDFIKEGAHIRANANGTRYFAVVNGRMFKGYVGGGPLTIRGIRVEPPVSMVAPVAYQQAEAVVQEQLRDFAGTRNAVKAAQELALYIRRSEEAFPDVKVKISADISGRTGKPEIVTVDLSRLGGNVHTPMFDDGKHGDAAAGDGRYATEFHLKPEALNSARGDWRRKFPGTTGLTVSAATADGRLSGAVGILAFLQKPESFSWWRERRSGIGCREPEGEVTIGEETDKKHIRIGRSSIEIAVAGGAWKTAWGNYWYRSDVTGFYAIEFWIKSDRSDNEDFYVQLRDYPENAYFTDTRPAGIIRTGALAGGRITSEYQRVVIPLKTMTKASRGFHSDVLAHVVFSGKGKSSRRYWIDDIRFLLTRDELKE